MNHDKILIVDYGSQYTQLITRRIRELNVYSEIFPSNVKAKELEIPIFSYPEYIYEQSKNKKRVVIGGSHGKTSITAMILHVLQNSTNLSLILSKHFIQ